MSPVEWRELTAAARGNLRPVLRRALLAARDGARAALEEAIEDPAFAHAWQACLAVPGWLGRPSARLLFALARSGPGEGAVVEIGSYLGRSTIALALGLKAGGREGKVFAIDPHEGELTVGDQARSLGGDTFPLFLRNLRGANVSEAVQPIRSTSAEAARTWTEPVRLLYVDGLHHYEAVRRDIELFAPRLTPGGAAIFDDYDQDGVRAAIHDAVGSGQLPRDMLRVGDLAVCGVPNARALRTLLFPLLRASAPGGWRSTITSNLPKGHHDL